ncbi:TPA: helix-turn-helix domain-containing protein [Serratia marcescens]|uniref:helix-turn-helix domain-containing protein n=1 Tax=Serratia TaxID=613 RepID=UPI0009A5874A|nr:MULTISPECIES: helix-turn-helix domain-containing protein [Serratia]AWC81884.1 helix-turn-helix domain-containing protein [Serratia marcescens]NGD66437.1 helix-turn-helix domain-containing protein [Serratia marcescens]WRV72543.1 helix-turn-helix domain-containing protein [Serratia sp. K-M0252]HBC5194003.1 helix-turn-helix domain-containing protein [Serratia marcescens]
MVKQSLTLNEACELLGVSRVTARKWIEAGRLKATRKDPDKPKSPYLITPEALRDALVNPCYQVQPLSNSSEEIGSENKGEVTMRARDSAKKLKQILAVRTKRN